MLRPFVQLCADDIVVSANTSTALQNCLNVLKILRKMEAQVPFLF